MSVRHHKHPDAIKLRLQRIREMEIMSISWQLLEKQDVLGIGYNFISYENLMEIVEFWRKKGECHYITFAPPYSIVLCRRDEQMYKATRQASLTLPDGIGSILAANILSYPHKRRITAPLTMLKLCDWGREIGWRHYIYGGAEGVADKLAKNIVEMYPELKIVGTYCPPFREFTEQEDEKVVKMINACKPDVVWVGLGAPKQEKWMANHVGRIKATVMMGVGATFNFHSGNVRWAPAWVRKIGLEWVYRMLQEPRHCWRRNVIYPWYVFSIIDQRVRCIFERKPQKEEER